jgi:HPt (histidine-containing phosphotransfer) domain-containing protein
MSSSAVSDSAELDPLLRRVVSMTQLLLGTELTAEQREYVEIIQRSGNALLAIVAPASEQPGVRVPQVLDVAQLEVVRNLQQASEPDLIAELIAVYFEEAGPMVAELRAAHSRADVGGVARAAHALKGASTNLGIRRIVALCAGVEDRAHAGSLADVDSVLRQLDEELVDARRALDAYCRERKAPA